MNDMRGFEAAISLLPPDLRASALALPPSARGRAEELRLRAGRRAALLLPEGELAFGPVVCPADLSRVLETATRASAHTALASVAQGYVTVRGGCRLGLCGEAVEEGGRVTGLRRLSSLAVRVPREARGCAEAVLPFLTAGGFADTLIVSPPGAGKTTLLRELVRRLSDGGARVSLIDQRGEVAAVWDGIPGFDVGERTDVMTGAPKAQAAMMLVRAMSPEILAMDELTSPEDLAAVETAAGCGVRLISTVHAASARELCRRPLYRRLLELGVFTRTVTIRRRGGEREYITGELEP